MGYSNYTVPGPCYTHCTTVNYSLATMQGILTILLIAHTVTAQTTNTKAASYRVNCGCQCSDLTFRDKYNRVQGNCKTADNTGAQWCYTEYGSTCEDQQRSTRFGRQGKTWSYQACSTPSIYSAQCAGYHGVLSEEVSEEGSVGMETVVGILEDLMEDSMETMVVSMVDSMETMGDSMVVLEVEVLPTVDMDKTVM